MSHASQDVKDRFRKLDKNRDGVLDFEELSALLRTGNPDLTDQEIQYLFEAVDQDNSGKVEFDEFVDYVFSRQKQTHLAPPGAKKTPLVKAERRRLLEEIEDAADRLMGQRDSSPAVSSRASSKGSVRSVSKKQVSPEEFLHGQTLAVQALVGHLSAKKTLGQVAEDLLIPTISEKDGSQPWTAQVIADALETSIQQKSPEVDPKEFANAVQKSPVTAGAIILATLRLLSSRTGIAFGDAAGQLLYRNRAEAPLTEAPHLKVVQDTRWIADNSDPSLLDLAAMTFKEVTMDTKGRMRWRTWMKVLRLMRRNPLVQEKFTRNDGDRLFKQESMKVMRREQAKGNTLPDGDSLGCKDFLRLLLQFSLLANLHPSVGLIAVGCHAEELAAQRQAKENGEIESRCSSRARSLSDSNSRASSRASSASGIRSRRPSRQRHTVTVAELESLDLPGEDRVRLKKEQIQKEEETSSKERKWVSVYKSH
eukprot:TRINITY_DN12188_c0_g1_i1.p1 TRINITY_DN12188_c0_g1~~TRINITY_DN12188_c0_g1_i1.p1  ORF type:complete len:480 (+),score=96.04 TRINITY_DN12188_c0_g1_i1:32-1471(+)